MANSINKKKGDKNYVNRSKCPEPQALHGYDGEALRFSTYKRKG